MRLTLFWKLLALTVGLVVGGKLLISAAWLDDAAASALAEAEAEAAEDLRAARARVKAFVRRLDGVARYFARAPETTGFVDSLGDPAEHPRRRERLSDHLRVLLHTSPVLYRARMLDHRGREQLRLEVEGEAVTVVPEARLQNEARRRYFVASRGLAAGQVYVSRLDLDGERGEVPWQPTLRVAVRIPSSSNPPGAVLVLNADAGPLLAGIDKALSGPGRTVFARRDDGGFVLHPDPDQRFGPERGRPTRGVGPSLPVYEVQADSTGEGDRRSRLSVALGPSRWLDLAVVTSAEHLRARLSEPRSRVALVSASLVALGVLLSAFLARLLTGPVRRLREMALAIGRGEPVDAGWLDRRTDEVGELGRAFGAMVESVRRRERELEQARDRIAAWLSASPVAMLSLDSTGRIVDVNPAGERLLGSPGDRLRGERLEERLQGAERGVVPPTGMDLAVVGGGSPLRVIARWTELEPTAVSPGRYVGTLVDVTTEASLRRALESSQLVAEIFTRSSDLFLVTDRDGRVVRANPEAEGRLGGHCVGKPLGELLPALVEPDVVSGSLVRLPSGTYQVGRQAAGELMIWQLVDLTELDERTRELEASNGALARFAANASHDLQAPARQTVHFAQHLLEDFGEALGPEGRRLVEKIQSAAERMRALVRSVLHLARIEGEDERPRRQLFVRDVIEEAKEVLHSEIEATGADIVLGGDLGSVVMDREQLVLLFTNLIGNAIKFRRPGTVPNVLVLREGGLAGFGRFTVEDDGVGIPDDRAEEVFEPFRRIHRTSRVPGFGLGLAMCARIVDRLGGRIWVDRDRPPPGTRIVFTLPTE